MHYFKKHLAGLVLMFAFFGVYGHPNWWRDDYAIYHAPGAVGSNWYAYPIWLGNEHYSNMPEKYAYPASLSSPHDPPWGFWFW
jgi:hypothetical protein